LIRLSASPADIARAAEILKNGGLTAFPTETVYGLGADAFNSVALARVFEVKGRPRFDPLIIHIASLDTLERIVKIEALDLQQKDLLEKCAGTFWPGPLTLVLPKRLELPGLATAGLPTAAIRFPSHPIAQQLIALSTGAVAAPSANPFGRLSPTRAEHVIEGLGDKIDCIIDGGPSLVGVESTVLELSPVFRILRPGGVSWEQLEAVIGPAADCFQRVDLKDADLAGDCDKTAETSRPSPGMLQSHYAPGIPLFLHSPEAMASLPCRNNEGYLFFSGKIRDTWLDRTSTGHMSDKCPLPKTILALSECGNVSEAASNLFEYLHVLEKSGISCIHAETLPEEGLGIAANDRLRRASVKSGRYFT
jgi:L-threonylcarbamoyladenylate synthase